MEKRKANKERQARGGSRGGGGGGGGGGEENEEEELGMIEGEAGEGNVIGGGGRGRGKRRKVKGNEGNAIPTPNEPITF